MYKLIVVYFDDNTLQELNYYFDNLRDIFLYIKYCIDDLDIFEFRIYRQ